MGIDFRRMPPDSNKKRKRSSFAEEHHPEKPSAKFKPAPATAKSLATVSVALPGSILLNAQSDELKALLASQVTQFATSRGIRLICCLDCSVMRYLLHCGNCHLSRRILSFIESKPAKKYEREISQKCCRGDRS